ncbi:protein YIPF1-like isoform X1 [Acanthaster planci]|uniref:Protein YIPF n=1 Tax=Acanthaster planci TaxID=133434 RepID=A0A8B7ZKV3_ACAPL|nr:protein YIPF1-like isoform X1 [Acanthaster planci]
MADENIILDTDTVRKKPQDTADDLKFHDFTDSQLLDDIGDEEGQTITFTNHPSDNEEEGDDTELLSGQKKQHSFWTFEYYQQFFDVDTSQVLWRLLGSFVPKPTTNYLQTQIRPNPDLYGPFWVCATLVFTIAISGDMADYIAHRNQAPYPWHAHFSNVTTAGVVIFLYAWLVPAAFYAFLHWRGNHAGYTFLELACLYGYSFTIYIPISLLWSINYDWLRWVLVGVALALSSTVLLMSLWPAVKGEDIKMGVPAMILVFLLHAALAVGFKLYFFEFATHAVDLVSTPAPNATATVHRATVTHAPTQMPISASPKPT